MHAQARPAGAYGFGEPPEPITLRNDVVSGLGLALRDPKSMQDFAIRQPEAACYQRGIGRRDVCGYKVCVAFNARNAFGAYVGRTVYVYWFRDGQIFNVVRNGGACPPTFPDWQGQPSIVVPDFCKMQPGQPACEAGGEALAEAKRRAAPAVAKELTGIAKPQQLRDGWTMQCEQDGVTLGWDCTLSKPAMDSRLGQGIRIETAGNRYCFAGPRNDLAGAEAVVRVGRNEPVYYEGSRTCGEPAQAVIAQLKTEAAGAARGYLAPAGTDEFEFEAKGFVAALEAFDRLVEKAKAKPRELPKAE